MFRLIFMILSFILCIFTKINIKKNDNLLNKMDRYILINAIALPVMCISALCGIFFGEIIAIPLPFAIGVFYAYIPMGIIISILLSLWHYKLLTKLKVLKASIIDNLVIYCKNCGNSMPADIEYCTNCGSRLREVR